MINLGNDTVVHKTQTYFHLVNLEDLLVRGILTYQCPFVF